MVESPGEIATKLQEKIRTKKAVVGVLGLGYVGLPLLHAFIKAGFNTIGFDVDSSKVQELLAGRSYIKHVGSEMILSWLENEQFDATTDMSRLIEADVLLVCVPTPLNESRDPDLRYVISTSEAIAQYLREGQLIVLESTTYPGTTKDVVVPILEKSELKTGEDYFVAYSPEREDPGNPTFSASSIPKVVGGINPNSLNVADELYSRAVVSTVPVSSCEVAEACKILENTYRSVNIAMVNELKVLFQKLGIDIWEVIDAAKTKPFGFQAFYPGPGLGGHCIPIDPFYLSWLARKNELSTRFIELAGEINTSMPTYVVQRVAEALNDHGKSVRGSKIGILGVAYKKDVDDIRESCSFKLIELLLNWGANISYSDPYVPKLSKMRHYDLPSLESASMTPRYLQSLDCALIATDHSEFDYEMIVNYCPLTVDTRNATKHVRLGREKICKS